MRKRLFVTRIGLLVLLLLLTGCGALSPEAEAQSLTILYTNDEHGWIAPDDENAGGAAAMMQRWRDEEGYTEDGPFLILSGGDTWTGPALSTWFHGEPTIEALNAMNYDAAAVGNHEFDFGPEGLRARSAEAEFPFLAANLFDAETGERSDLALPYVIREVGDLQVGIIGLASTGTPKTTMPTHVEGLTFAPYAEALEATVPEVKDEGADMLVVIGHICSDEMEPLAESAAELGIAMIGGGHCHERVNQIVNGGVLLIESGAYMQAYARIDLTVDTRTGEVVESTAQIKENPTGPQDGAVASIVDAWQARLDDALAEVIGYTEHGIRQRSPEMFNMVTDAWLAFYPADIAMSNSGGFRQDIPPGDITLADVVGVLPFDNVLIDCEITGQEIIASYQHSNRKVALGGMRARAGYELLDGTPLDPEATYQVLVNDFMYAGGSGFRFQEYDPDAYHTGIDWRQPVMDWITKLNTSPDDPLENYLDSEWR
jgi:2',3'-cyclic-nucleotide 2'-phosphodiesterase (5'-nucleotidase family)